MAVLGKSCGPCTMCCKVLEIEHFDKRAGTLCTHCKIGTGCKIYKKRPEVCQDYECSWMMERDLPSTLRPDKVGTILMEDAESDQYQAVCDPAKPMAWRHPLVFKHLLMKAKEGRVVVAKAGLMAWRIYDNGEVAPWA